MLILKSFTRTSDPRITARDLMNNLYNHMNKHKGDMTYLNLINKIKNPNLIKFKDTISTICEYYGQLGTNDYRSLKRDQLGTLLEHAISCGLTNINKSWIINANFI